MLLDWDTEHPARSLAVEVFALTEGLEGDFFAGEPREERGKAALTELFETVRNGSTPIIVEKVVEEIDNVVRQVRFDGWQSTSEGDREVRRQLRLILVVKFKIKSTDVFGKAHEYIREYY
ncbi:MAG: hypothetical protein KHZ52_08125 [Actinomyces graevenitzii]|nr:hypothetical protein [Actinomyces graevenitzii]